MQRHDPIHLRLLATSFVVVLSILAAECGGTEMFTSPSGTSGGAAAPPPPPLSDTALPVVEQFAPEVFVGAGDIALCTGDGREEDTARLLDSIAGTVFTLGDNAYVTGSTEAYRNCYDRSWGRHKARTRPVAGNHEYQVPGALPYFEYFGANAGPRGLGYYSFNLGGWHIVALNSNVPVSAGSAQGAWLRADLSASRAACTLAYWHHPRFSSGPHGDQGQMRDFWQILQEAGAEIVLSGHDHFYERFRPLDSDGIPDSAHGIRQFVVGTGGARPYPVMNIGANSEMRLISAGVLKLTLSGGRYDWEFVPVSGSGDFGSGVCH